MQIEIPVIRAATNAKRVIRFHPGHWKPDKWTSFLLSLLVPGTGQLYAGSWTCIAWFVAAGVSVAGTILIEPYCGSGGAAAVRVVALILLGIVSAEDAKRLLELGSAARPTRRRSTPAGKLTVTSARTSGRKIDERIEVCLDRSTEDLWNIISDLPTFLTIDPFHEKVVVMRRRPAAGVHLVLQHNALGRRFSRYGKILRWREGEQYAFSDLSGAGQQRGFPHVFFISVQQFNPAPLHASTSGSRLTIRVRGKWTSRLIPARVGRWWVQRVCREHGRLLRKAL